MKNLAIGVAIGLLLCSTGSQKLWAGTAGNREKVSFEHVVVDADGPLDMWLKSVGDLNGDGRPDLIAGGHEEGGLVWYENPTWEKHVIDRGSFSTDGEAVDVDGDGDQDVVALKAKELLWYENPGWAAHHIDDVVLHDIEVADLDGDGRPDIAGRNQGAFSAPKGDTLYLYRQESPMKWTKRTVEIPDGEGLAVARIDDDKHPDIVIGQFWIENPGDIEKGAWTLHKYGEKWTYPQTFVATGDINGDGRLDIVLSPSEKAGGVYRISWFEAPRNPRTGKWKEHIVEDNVETAYHFVGVADFNRDGALDIATAEMQQGKSPDVRVYVNTGKGRKWTKNVVASTSSHSMRIVDVDGDGWPDLYGADWRGSRAVDLWRNTTGDQAAPAKASSGRIGMELWTYRRQLEADLPGTLAKIRSLGFKDIETASFYGHSAAEFRRLLDEHGLTCSSIIANYDKLKNDLSAVIADAKALGAHYVITAGFPHKGRLLPEEVNRAADDFNAWGAKLKSEGLQFGYHPHSFEFVPAGSGFLFDVLLAKTKPNLVTYELDTYHMLQGGAQPLSYLKRYPDRFELMHLKDMAKGTPTGLAAMGKPVGETSVVLGTGVFDWPAIFAAARNAGVKIYYIEDESATALAQVPASIQYLKSLHVWKP